MSLTGDEDQYYAKLYELATDRDCKDMPCIHGFSIFINGLCRGGLFSGTV